MTCLAKSFIETDVSQYGQCINILSTIILECHRLSGIHSYHWRLKYSCGTLKGVLLTKDNLSRRNLKGDKICVVCSSTYAIQHLFLSALYAKFLWCVYHIALGIASPLGTSNLFGTWSHNGGHNNILMLGASSFCWVLWLSRNDVVFRKIIQNLFCRFYSRELVGFTYGPSCSESEEWTQIIVDGCQWMESMALQVFASFGRPHVVRISFWFLDSIVVNNFLWNGFVIIMVWFYLLRVEAGNKFPLSK